MTTYEILFTAEAEGDLDAIFDHVAASSGEDRARSILSSLVGACLALDRFPAVVHRATTCSRDCA